MKTQNFKCAILLIVFLTSIGRICAQSYQVDLHSEFENVIAYCLERPMDGEFTYHLTYHVDKKTGFVNNVHWNILHAEIRDSETGKKYIVVDTGHDKLGVMWTLYNNINDYTDNQFDIEHGYMPLPVEAEDWPDEGAFVSMAFKFIDKGKIYRMQTLIQIHKNASGEITAEVNKSWIDCN